LIITKGKISVRNSGIKGKWKQGFITLSSNIMRTLGFNKQEVLMVLIHLNERMPTSKEIEEAITDYGNYLLSKEKIEYMKREVQIDGETGESKTIEELFHKQR